MRAAHPGVRLCAEHASLLLVLQPPCTSERVVALPEYLSSHDTVTRQQNCCRHYGSRLPGIVPCAFAVNLKHVYICTCVLTCRTVVAQDWTCT